MSEPIDPIYITNHTGSVKKWNQSEINPEMKGIPIEKAIQIAIEIDRMYSEVVTKNTGLKTGFFSGLSINDVAKVIRNCGREDNDDDIVVSKHVGGW